MPAQTLQDGKTLAKYLPQQGGIDFSTAKPLAIPLPDGTIGTLAQYSCSAGGNGAPWPSMILLYSDSGALLADTPLSEYTKAEHAGVTAWQADGTAVTVTWQSFDGAGGPGATTDHHSTLTYRNGTLSLT